MNARLNIAQIPAAMKAMKHISAANQELKALGLPAELHEMVALRVSQINGCAFCIDMHTKELAHAGADATRVALVAAWREATVFEESERAAFELAEQGTRIADAAGGVPDEVWDNAAKHFNEDQLAALVVLISIMNTFNRGNVMLQNPAGGYVPGQMG